MAARAKAEAVRSLDRGDLLLLSFAAGCQSPMIAAPASAVMAMERNALANLDADLAAGDVKRARKGHHQNYQARRRVFLMTNVLLPLTAEWIARTISRHPTSALAEPVPRDQLSAPIGCWHCDSVHVHPVMSMSMSSTARLKPVVKNASQEPSGLPLLTQRMVPQSDYKCGVVTVRLPMGVFEPC